MVVILAIVFVEVFDLFYADDFFFGLGDSLGDLLVAFFERFPGDFVDVSDDDWWAVFVGLGAWRVDGGFGGSAGWDLAFVGFSVVVFGFVGYDRGDVADGAFG